MHEYHLLEDTNLWYAVAVLCFVAIMVKFARKGIAGALDAQIEKIRNELDDAKRLREEAAAALAATRDRQSEAMKEAERIVSQAKTLAAKLHKESEEELKQTLKRHEEMALARIARVQEETKADVRDYLINEALVEARGKLAKDAKSPEALALIDRIIADIPKMKDGKVA